jgi:hypothetical protein
LGDGLTDVGGVRVMESAGLLLLYLLLAIGGLLLWAFWTDEGEAE